MTSSSPADARVALVTGSSRGIGRAVAGRLAADGYALALHGSRPGTADATAAEVEAASGRAPLVVSGDVADPAAVKDLLRAVFDRYRRLDALVLNAGTHEVGRLGMMADASIQRLFAVNAVGAALVLQGSVRLLQRGSDPAVVLVSSVMATTAAPGQAVYGASKAAVSGLTRSAARELGPSGVRVNAVAPGYIATDMLETLDEAGRAEQVAATPLGRLGEASDVADVVAFLLSRQSRFITGQVLGVDGGVVV